MKKTVFSLVALLALSPVFSQNTTTGKTAAAGSISRPKLVVGIVIDQMRWDYLYRYNNLFKPNGGFKRFLGEGFTCENTFIPYTPTYTAAGHTCVYTGSVPNIHGIVGNNWYDQLQQRVVYCAEDKSVTGVGSNTPEGQMSPRNMLANTVGDELRLATNFKSKVIGVALKDRGAILPAGHGANAAYWYDGKTGDFITSTYYMKQLPAWVQAFNQRKLVDSLYKLNWNPILNKSVYGEYSTEDEKAYEGKPFNNSSTSMPYSLEAFAGKDYSKISSTPHGNTLTAEMAKAAVLAEQLGKGTSTDFLAVSFSSPDYVGHTFGPNSWEQLDDYVRLDETIGKLFEFLDATVGKNQYTVFLTADHGVAHVPGFMKEHNMPGGLFTADIIKNLNTELKTTFGLDNLVTGDYNYQVHLNHKRIDSANASTDAISTFVVNYLKKQESVANAFELSKLMTSPMNNTLRERFANGYYPTRSGDIQFMLKPGYVEGGATGTTHGLWNPYDAHIPLLWYGWGIKHGKTNRETYMTDIAPTVSSLLHIQMPNGSVGHVIEEVYK
ncbi:alkaline phosphatase PafA [Deminuibacter soli]|uniref:Alkaline phosphatase family protein n=1 Tax=Deminuibacter soli TaxID=2291815 RepID=A0A3E1NMK9_9BACT|nr:alkaline phosphatase PafA [Deminuibacter soli]RFM29166.1 alkaline phosphatase family protein [Deminuibacter soli]